MFNSINLIFVIYLSLGNKKSNGLISKSPILELPLQVKSSLKVTQRAEE